MTKYLKNIQKMILDWSKIWHASSALY